MNRISLMLAILMVIASMGATPGVPRIALAETPTIDFIGQATVPTSGNVKFPQIRGRDNVVHLAGSGGSGDNNVARYWRKNADGTLLLPEPKDLGPAIGQSNYASSDLTIAPNGRIYVLWNHIANQSIYLLSSDTGTEWSTDARKTVIAGGGFRVYPRIAAANDRLWVIWNQDGRYRYRTTTDVSGGGGWSGTQLVSGRETINSPSVAVSPDGSRMAVAYGVSAGDIYVGIWNGSGFTERLIADTNLYLADPTIAFGPDNRIWVAWRAVEGGIFFSRENDAGNFPPSRLLSAESYGTVSITVDPQGYGHIFWVGNRGDGWKAYYTRQATDGSWVLRVADPGAFIANGIGTVTVSDFAYGHGVTEYFGGTGLRTRYYLFRSQGGNCVAAITIGNALPGTDPPVVTAPAVVGTLSPAPGCTPAEQRVVLNAQDAQAPAEPWTGTYNMPITNLEQCVQTVNVQLRADNRSQFDSQWRSVSFIADPQTAETPVDALVSVTNPSVGLPTLDTVTTDASRGDVGYTRIPTMRLVARDVGDCTGLAGYSIVHEDDTVFATGVFPSRYGGEPGLGLPPQVHNGTLAVGETTFKVRVTDRAGNVTVFPRRLVYDPPGTGGEGRPVLTIAATDLAPDTQTTTIIRSLIINTIVVTDNLYRRGASVPDRGYMNTQTPSDNDDPTKQFWGLWIAVEYLGKDANAVTIYPSLPHGDVTFENLRWQAVEVPHAEPGAGVRFNLFNGVLDRTAVPPTNGFGADLTKDGTYRVYVKALDGAGNASVETYSTTLRLDPGYTVLTIGLPFIGR